MKNKELYAKMLSKPLTFSSDDFDVLIASYKEDGKYNTRAAFDDLRECVRRIYDLNENRLRETSNANEGTIGKLNRKSTEKRLKLYYQKIREQKPGKKYVRIYAEGDSWFQFPIYVDDVIDWLNKRDDYLIFSEAYGGDWITNIIYEGQYIEALTTHSPDVFLISGGGNDLVGNNRLAIMVNKAGGQDVRYTAENPPDDPELSSEQRSSILRAQPYINKEFYAFMHVVKAQYTLLFKSLYANDSKHREMISITQGYAYPYPKSGANYSLKYPLQPLFNKVLDSGCWLHRPMMIKGILDPSLQRDLVMTFLYEFNQLMIDIASNPEFPKVYHIDSRSIPKNQKDWFDELHLKSHNFKKVADLFAYAIDNYKTGDLPKVIRPTEKTAG